MEIHVKNSIYLFCYSVLAKVYIVLSRINVRMFCCVFARFIVSH